MGWEMNCPSSPQLPSAPLIVICSCSLGNIDSRGKCWDCHFLRKEIQVCFYPWHRASGLFMLKRDVTLVSEAIWARSLQPLSGAELPHFACLLSLLILKLCRYWDEVRSSLFREPCAFTHSLSLLEQCYLLLPNVERAPCLIIADKLWS